MSDGRVTYEGWFGNSNAAFARFGRALVEHHIKLVDSYIQSRETIIVMVSATSENAASFAKAAKLSLKYRSPTIFYNGTLLPYFASPEDELAGKKTQSALYAEKKYEEEKDE